MLLPKSNTLLLRKGNTVEKDSGSHSKSSKKSTNVRAILNERGMKEKIKRVAGEIRKTMKCSEGMAQDLARKSIAKATKFDREIHPGHPLKQFHKRDSTFFERGKGDEIKDKDYILDCIAKGKIPEQRPSGKITIIPAKTKIWTPPGSSKA